MTLKTDIYFVDFTHTGTIVSADFFPLGIGYVAAYLSTKFDGRVEVELFKYPNDLSAALEKRVPRIVAFSNYTWNLNLSYEYIKQIKQRHPETVTVMGGPNYGLSKEEIDLFWKRYPLIDFYIVLEGELAMVELVKALVSNNYDVDKTKRHSDRLPNCHYQFQDRLVEVDLLPRIKDLNDLPSPYLMGLMDKFFDGTLIPLISSTRGCPFRCTFCSEGSGYYNKVIKRYDLAEEMTYIAERIGAVKDLCFTDANFGMFNEDLEKARVLAQIQKKYDWPRRLTVSTGKNQKARVVEVASLLSGAMYVGGAIQSTDEEVLKNIKRSNISLKEMGTRGSNDQNDLDSYTELILALPGDSIESHTKSLKDMVDIGVNMIKMYQLIMLPQTEIVELETRKKYGMLTRFRLTPRSFGRYSLWGNTFLGVESEEVCVGNNTLSFEDYLDCRELDLTIEILNNGRLFNELHGLCEQFKFSWFDVISAFHECRRKASDGLKKLYDSFRRESMEGYWNTPEELENSIKQNIAAYLDSGEGTNEMAKGKARAVFYLMEDLHNLLFQAMGEELQKRGFLNAPMRLYLNELKTYSWLRKKALLDTSASFDADLHFDFQSISEKNFVVDPEHYMLGDPVKFIFCHNEDQANLIQTFLKQYGPSLDGLGRILMRAHSYQRLIRDAIPPDAGLTMIPKIKSMDFSSTPIF